MRHRQTGWSCHLIQTYKCHQQWNMVLKRIFRDFRRPPPCSWRPHSCGKLNDTCLKLITDVSGQLIGPILKDQAIYDGKDMLSQSVGEKPQTATFRTGKASTSVPTAFQNDVFRVIKQLMYGSIWFESTMNGTYPDTEGLQSPSMLTKLKTNPRPEIPNTRRITPSTFPT